MGYHRMVLLALLVGLLAPCSELQYLSPFEKAVLPRHCTQPPKSGKCRHVLLHFYYDVYRKWCQPFIYSGCEGNDNNFESFKDCIYGCHIFVEMAQRHPPPGPLPQNCSLPKKTGRCKAAFKKYYYNTKTKKCEEFTYGGCGGNGNNFEDIDDCVEKCQRFGDAIRAVLGQ